MNKGGERSYSHNRSRSQTAALGDIEHEPSTGEPREPPMLRAFRTS